MDEPCLKEFARQHRLHHTQVNGAIKKVFLRIQSQLAHLSGLEVCKIVIIELKLKDSKKTRDKIYKSLYDWKIKHNIKSSSVAKNASKHKDISVKIIVEPKPDNPEICRLCSATSDSLDPDQLVKCFDFHRDPAAAVNNINATTDIVNIEVADILNQHFWFKLSPDRDAGAFVCRQCWLKLDAFHQFFQSVRIMYEKLEMEVQRDARRDVVPDAADHNVDTTSTESELRISNVWSAIDHEWPPIDIKAEYEVEDSMSLGAEATSTRNDEPMENEASTTADVEYGADGSTPSDAEATAVRDKETLALHLETHSNNNDHLKTETPLAKQQQSQRTEVSAGLGYRCRRCPDKYFMLHDNYNRHLVAEHQSTRLQCDICRHWLMTWTALRLHKQIRHNADARACQDCGKVLSNRYSLALHELRIHGRQQHQCLKCGEMLESVLALRKHVVQHLEEDKAKTTP